MNTYSKTFKRASIGLLLTIIKNINSRKSSKYYKYFQKELNISSTEFHEILELQEFHQLDNILLNDEVEIIIKELEYKRHQIIKFLMLLNRCIIIDGCNIESYQKFEKIRDIFIKKL